jgi:hypothetical protein
VHFFAKSNEPALGSPHARGLEERENKENTQFDVADAGNRIAGDW